MQHAATLAGLALLDSTSLGTLVIPIALVVRSRRVERGPMAVYLSTVCLVYLGLGIALVAGFDLIGSTVARLAQTQAAQWATLVIGVALAAFGILGPDPVKPEPGTDSLGSRPTPTSTRAMILLGLGASLAEAATMVPYIAATGIIAASPTSWPTQIATLVLYCLVMIAPALILLTLADALGQRFLPRLARIAPRLEHEAKVTLLWVAAILGIHLAWRSAAGLGLVG
ncbi:GAP family protein [Actinomyces sp. ZJ308]|uniref:GAP family protein n=1 Tax=Actinomyces sp. ZJ308 TaxID=2708342 RepID=UPI0014218E26|nr:GAP family protein [Actinomyces sp. ZJ308]